MTTAIAFSARALELDATAAAARIEEGIREQVWGRLRRRGAVVAVSGGIDSSVTAALCVRALGKDRVFGLLMPEYESSGDSLRLGRRLAEDLGIEFTVENIGPTLEALGCYRRRDAAIRLVIPEYGPGWKSKIVRPNLVEGSRYPVYSVVAQGPSGEVRRERLTPEACRGVVAATNFKQRTRKMLEYYHADRLWYAVAGTPNRLEYAQGFFVKNGDGAADFKPIAHLYKTQVYQLAEHLGIPEEIRRRTPMTDTYSLPQTQEEFYFSLPLEITDLCLYGHNHGISSEEVARATGLSPEQARRMYELLEATQKSTRYLHAPALLVEPVEEVRE